MLAAAHASSCSSSSSAPPITTWLCCAPPTAGRAQLLLFLVPAPGERGCLCDLLLIYKTQPPCFIPGEETTERIFIILGEKPEDVSRTATKRKQTAAASSILPSSLSLLGDYSPTAPFCLLLTLHSCLVLVGVGVVFLSCWKVDLHSPEELAGRCSLPDAGGSSGAPQKNWKLLKPVGSSCRMVGISTSFQCESLSSS